MRTAHQTGFANQRHVDGRCEYLLDLRHWAVWIWPFISALRNIFLSE